MFICNVIDTLDAISVQFKSIIPLFRKTDGRFRVVQLSHVQISTRPFICMLLKSFQIRFDGMLHFLCLIVVVPYRGVY